MSWLVYDVLSDQERAYGSGRFEVFGPLPKKRWVKEAKRKAHKLSYKFSYKRQGAESADDYNERRAKEYARWLAKRDGIALPDNRAVRVEWSGFYSDTKKRNVKTWNGTKQRAAYCKRIFAVYFGDVRIQIPNWDFDPIEPVEEIISDEMLLAA